jgi:hypothetical protein
MEHLERAMNVIAMGGDWKQAVALYDKAAARDVAAAGRLAKAESFLAHSGIQDFDGNAISTVRTANAALSSEMTDANEAVLGKAMDRLTSFDQAVQLASLGAPASAVESIYRAAAAGSMAARTQLSDALTVASMQGVLDFDGNDLVSKDLLKLSTDPKLAKGTASYAADRASLSLHAADLNAFNWTMQNANPKMSAEDVRGAYQFASNILREQAVPGSTAKPGARTPQSAQMPASSVLANVMSGKSSLADAGVMASLLKSIQGGNVSASELRDLADALAPGGKLHDSVAPIAKMQLASAIAQGPKLDQDTRAGLSAKLVMSCDSCPKAMMESAADRAKAMDQIKDLILPVCIACANAKTPTRAEAESFIRMWNAMDTPDLRGMRDSLLSDARKGLSAEAANRLDAIAARAGAMNAGTAGRETPAGSARAG